MLKQRPAGVFSFPALTSHFCRLFREEVEHFEQSGMPLAHPNTMNKNGLLMYELGMYEGLLDPLLEQWILPLSTALYAPAGGETQAGAGAQAGAVTGAGPGVGAGAGAGAGSNAVSNAGSEAAPAVKPPGVHTPGASTLDHHRSFTVSYEVGKDVDLAYHFDDSEITLNVNLGGKFEGGELLFGGVQGGPEVGLADISRYVTGCRLIQ